MDVDPLVLGETDPGALLAGKIVATIVAGKVVYRAGDQGARRSPMALQAAVTPRRNQAGG